MFAGWKVQPGPESGWSTLYDTKNCPAVRNTLYSNTVLKIQTVGIKIQVLKGLHTQIYIPLNIRIWYVYVYTYKHI